MKKVKTMGLFDILGRSPEEKEERRKNKSYEVGEDVEVAGMLLYARTSDKIQPEHEYLMSGNKISVRTLNLNQDFKYIKNDLLKIASDYFDLECNKEI